MTFSKGLSLVFNLPHTTTMDNSLHIPRQTTIFSSHIQLCYPRHNWVTEFPNSTHKVPNSIKVNTIVWGNVRLKETPGGTQNTTGPLELKELPKFLTEQLREKL